MARTAAADEVLLAGLEPEGNLARVSLRRLAGSDGRVLWTETFDVASDPADLRTLADAVTVHLRRGFPDHPPRPGTPDLEVADADYADYLATQERLNGGRTPTEAERGRIEAIARRSPRFLSAQLLAAEVALSLFTSTRQPADLERARAFTRQAEALAPGDVRPLVLRFRVATAGNRGTEPEAALARLAAALPGDPSILVHRASLAELRGRTEEALADLRTAAGRVPSWNNLLRLAELEWRTGRIADARKHFETLLERSPGNVWGLESLAKIELLAGDPTRAERLFEELLARTPAQRSLWTDLGLARFLAGKNGPAVEAYQKALALAPGHSTVLLNLADAELALGHREAALAHYRQALERLTEAESTAAPSLDDSMGKAQCLAHLGRAGEAAEIAQRILQQNPGVPGVIYDAALVYALVGDRTSARINARAARRQGIGESWFRIAAFDGLRGDPEIGQADHEP
jgi:serine/threonine-protein kinase